MALNSNAQIGLTRAEVVHQIGSNYNETHDENGQERITRVTYPSGKFGSFKLVEQYRFDENEICIEYVTESPLSLIDITVSFLNKNYQSIKYNVWYDKEYDTIIKIYPMTESNVMIMDYTHP
jgi:hypothetical protein